MAKQPRGREIVGEKAVFRPGDDLLIAHLKIDRKGRVYPTVYEQADREAGDYERIAATLSEMAKCGHEDAYEFLFGEIDEDGTAYRK